MAKWCACSFKHSIFEWPNGVPVALHIFEWPNGVPVDLHIFDWPSGVPVALHSTFLNGHVVWL